ncbi:variant leucine-rich repeat-containing protein [Bifidobacterium choloepi]|nr:FHA domain-containing protein [Bifidobacterium choloepi]
MRWVIRVDGSDVASVDAGQTIEIGRKPIRPLPAGRYPRVEILDDTRSMSKRHAEFSVKSDGTAFLRDLNSTNGSYLVRTGSELRRLPVGSDFALRSDSVRIQFGDVPVDFVRVAVPQSDSAVSNLFDYATGNAAGNDSPDMSVDTILNLRAGEPTDIFDAGSVRTRAAQLRAAEQESFAPLELPINPPALVEDQPDANPEEHPRDLFADAHDIAAGKMEEPAPREEPFKPEYHDGPRHKSPDSDANSRERLVSIQEIASGRLHSASPDYSAVKPVTGTQQPVAAAGQPATTPEETVAATPAEQAEPAAQDSQPLESTQSFNPLTDFSWLVEERETGAVDGASPDESFQRSAAEGMAAAETAGENAAEDYSRFQRPATDETTNETAPAAETAAEPGEAGYMPAFEAGSVFERITASEAELNREVVEAGGFTSDQARRTDDYTEQFEMARHPELLPFLAMNPSLYEDLYAWLAAQGNADVDEALGRNAGYAEYLKKSGK